MPASMMWSEQTPTSTGWAETSSPRYEIPWQVYAEDDSEPEFGSCWNCEHMIDIRIGDDYYMLCVHERDMKGSGDVIVCDGDVRECPNWYEG